MVQFAVKVLASLSIKPKLQNIGEVAAALDKLLLNNYPEYESLRLQLNEEITKEVSKFLRKHPKKTKELTKIALKPIASAVVTQAIVMTSTKAAIRVATKGATKLFNIGAILGIVADVAQAGLEWAGFKEEGELIGMTGNVISGIMLGGAVGGPVGACGGAFLGFVVWGLGEVTGSVIDRALEETTKKLVCFLYNVC